MSEQNKPQSNDWKPITDGYQPRPVSLNLEQHGYKPQGSVPQAPSPPQGGTGSSKPK